MNPSNSTEPLRSRFAGDAEMAELVQEFVQELPARMQTLGGFWRASQFDDLRRAAHQLKGAAGGYGFPTISESAGKVEDMLKSSVDIKQMEELQRGIDELIGLCRRASGE